MKSANCHLVSGRSRRERDSRASAQPAGLSGRARRATKSRCCVTNRPEGAAEPCESIGLDKHKNKNRDCPGFRRRDCGMRSLDATASRQMDYGPLAENPNGVFFEAWAAVKPDVQQVPSLVT